MGYLDDSVVKNPPANAGDAGDTGSIPGLGRSLGWLEEEMATHSSILEISWTEDSGGLHIVHGIAKELDKFSYFFLCWCTAG